MTSQLNGGGNIKSLYLYPCNNVGYEETKDYIIFQHVDQTTTSEQRLQFIENLEHQIDIIKTSCTSLKNQNSKLAFNQSVNWLKANQLVVFDIMLGITSSNIDIIELFEDSILKLLDSIENIIKKSKNVYIAYVLSQQTSTIAASVYRFNISNEIDHKRGERITELKEKIVTKLNLIFIQLEKLKKNDFSINYLEQSLKIIQSFGLALPDQKQFQPIMNIASGLGKMLISGGTNGLTEMFSGIKSGISQIVNENIQQEQIDNFIMFINLERIKFEINKILLDKKLLQTDKDQQIKQILYNLNENLKNNTNWFTKYYFVQILSELILYEPQINSETLTILLNEKQILNIMDADQVWDLLIKNNWITQFKLEHDQKEKNGFLQYNRQSLEGIEIYFQEKQKIKLQKEKKSGIKKFLKKKISPEQENFSLNLNQILQTYELISQSLREFIVNGDQTFKGLINYSQEGLEDQTEIIKNTLTDLLQDSDPIEVIQISLEQIISQASNFFDSSFQNLIQNSMGQLRNVLAQYLRDSAQDIENYILQNHQFESILQVNSTLKKFMVIQENFDEQQQNFSKKINEFSTQIFDFLKNIQIITNSMQENYKQNNLVQNFIESHSQQLINEQQNTIGIMESQFNQLIQNSDKQQDTKDYLNKVNNFLQTIEKIIFQHEKLKVFTQILQIDIQQLNIPQLFNQLAIINKKSLQQSIVKFFTTNSSTNDTREFIKQIRKQLEECKKKMSDFFQNTPKSELQPPEIQEQIFFYIRLVNQFLKNQIQNHKLISEQLGKLIYKNYWVDTINEKLKQIPSSLFTKCIKRYLADQKKQKKQPSKIKKINQQILEFAQIIDEQDYQDELNSDFLNYCDQMQQFFKNMDNLLINDFLQRIKSLNIQLKIQFPELKNEMNDTFQTIVSERLNLLKNQLQGPLIQIQQNLKEDIYDIQTSFQNNFFSCSILNQLQSIKSNLVDIGGSLLEKFQDQTWRIRDKTVIILFDCNKMFGGENGSQLYANALIQLKAKDTNQKVQQTLRNEEMLQEMKNILTHNWKSQESEIKAYIQKHFKELDEQVEKMKLENASQDYIFKMYQKNAAKLNKQLENISDIGQMAGIQIEFLKDIQNQLFKLCQNVEEIKNSISQVDDKLTFIKGKSLYQLLEDRRKKVFSRESESQNIDDFLELKAIECLNNQKIGKKAIKIVNTEQLNEPDDPIYNIPICKIQKLNKYHKLSGRMSFHQILEIFQDPSSSESDHSISSHTSIKEEQMGIPMFDIDEHIEKLKRSQSQIDPIQFQKSHTQIVEQSQSKKKNNIIDIFTNEKNNQNSLLIHGYPGSGKQRISQQIEQQLWMQRRITKEFIYKKLQMPKSIQLRKHLAQHSINQIFQQMQEIHLIDKQGFFRDFFIQIESEMEDFKDLEEIMQENEIAESDVSKSEENIPSSNLSEEQDKYILKDIQSQKAEIYLSQKFKNLSIQEDICYAFYDLLDDVFQGLPFPIYIKLGEISNPKNLLEETLKCASQYCFDDKSIRSLTNLAKKGEIKLIFILDGYELLKGDLFGINLYKYNQFEELTSKEDRKYLYPKVITTCNNNVLNDNDYSSKFQNVLWRINNQNYFPDQYYKEYMIENLNKKQITKFLKKNCLQNIKSLVYQTSEMLQLQFSDQLQSIIKNIIYEQLQFQFDNFDDFWKNIENQIKKQKINKQIYIPNISKQKIIDEIYQYANQFKQKQFTLEQQNILKNKLDKILTNKQYQMIIKIANLNQLLHNKNMLQTFTQAIELYSNNMNSYKKYKSRIQSVLKQEEIGDIDDIIKKLKKPIGVMDNFLDKFNICQDYNITIDQIQELLQIPEEDLVLKNNLIKHICFALFNYDVTRFKFYQIFFKTFIKKQIFFYKNQGKFLGNDIPQYRDCKSFAIRLSNTFYKENIESIKYENQSQLYQIKSVWDEFFNDIEKPIRENVRLCIPLQCQDSVYSFYDSSIKNYILAYQYYRSVNNLQLDKQLLEIIILFIKNNYGIEEIKLKKKKINFLNKESPLKEEKSPFIQSRQLNSNSRRTSLINQSITLNESSQQVLINSSLIKQIREIQTQMEEIKNQFSSQFSSVQNTPKEQKVKTLILENIVNDEQIYQRFIKFYKKYVKEQKNVNLKDSINSAIKQLNIILELQLNQSQQLYSYKNYGICEFLYDKMRVMLIQSQKNFFINNLKTIIQLAEFDHNFQVSASNSIGLLIYSNYPFNSINFTGLDLSNANLYGGQFYRCTFDSCNLSRSNLSFTTFYKCRFLNSDFTNSILRDSQLIKCKFIKGNFQSVRLLKNSNIDYQQIIFIKNKMTNQMEKDPLIHVMVNPFDSDYILAFHTQQVYLINIKLGKVSPLKKFDKPFSNCGMIELKHANQIIAGQGDNIILLDLKNMKQIDSFKLSKITTISCINYNNGDILVGGAGQTDKYIELAQFKGTGVSQVLIEGCDLIDIDSDKKIIYCHDDQIQLNTSTLVCFKQDDYTQIGLKQTNVKNLRHVNYKSLQRLIKIKKKHAIDHPTFKNIHLQMEQINNIIEINVSTEKSNIDQIRFIVKDVGKYGKPSQMILNPIFDKQIIFISEYGLIQRFNFFTDPLSNFELVKDTQQQVLQVQFLIPVQNKDRQLLSCCINDQFSGVVTLQKFLFDIENNSNQINKFQIFQEYQLNIKHEQNQVLKNFEIIGMQNHDVLLDQFILITLENKMVLKKFVLSYSLSGLNKLEGKNDLKNLNLKDLQDGNMFNNFQIHPKNHDIFFFSFDQTSIEYGPRIVIFQLAGNQLLQNIQFKPSIDSLWKLQFKSFDTITLHNSLGEFKVYNNIMNDYSQNIEPLESLTYEKFDNQQVLDIVGFLPNSQQSMVFYDYLNSSITTYDLIKKIKITNIIDFQQIYINNQIKNDKNLSKKKGKCMKVNYFQNVKDNIEFQLKNQQSSLQQKIETGKYEEIMQLYKDRMQLIFHPNYNILFIIFLNHKVMVVFNLDKKKIIQTIRLPFYFDTQFPLKMTTYNRNQNILICSYHQTINIFLYKKIQEKEEFTNIYTKMFGKSIFSFENSSFEQFKMNKDCLLILEQNQADIKKENNQIEENN